MNPKTRFLLASAALCLAAEPCHAEQLIDFETGTVGNTPNGWSFDGDGSTVRIASTSTNGGYTGGQAIRTDEGGASFAGYAYSEATITSLQADFLWDFSPNTPTLAVYAWDDADSNGFQSGERTIGFGLDNDGQFELSSENGEISGSTNFSPDTWYRLTMTWGEPDGSGDRLVTLSAYDLTNGNDLGVVNSDTMTAAEFGADPSEWDGIAFRMTRGTIDNIQISTQAVLSGTYTYVDASPANTTLNTDPVNFPGGVPLTPGSNYVDDGTSGSGSDGLWTFRTDSGFASFENGNAFECDSGSVAGDAETTADLITTVTLPTPGTYDIVAVFTRAANRDIAAGLGAGPDSADIFDSENSLNADQNADPLQIEFDDSYSNGRGESSGVAYLGTVTTTADNEEVRIFVNGLASTAETDDERTQYEGVAYHLPTVPPPPEPKHRDVFILAGQSNCDGRGRKAELTGGLADYAGQQEGVLIHYTNPAYGNSNKSLYKKWVTLEPGFSRPPGDGSALPTSTFGMEIGAGKVLASHYANPCFIKVSRGGTALGVPGADWYPAPLGSSEVGPLYEALIDSTRAALSQLEANGDTYTVHGMFWHQGESDGGRTAEYGALLTELIERVRSDLELPDLRFLVGELSPTKPQAFRDVQWEVTRTVPSAGFISSRGLSTRDGTHFTTPSMITFGERLGHALRPDRDVLDFETPTYATGALDRQDDCAATLGLASDLQVVTTASEGEYTGGQAAGHVGADGDFFFTRRHFLPLAGARMIQADFFPGDTGFDDEADADSSLLVAAWGTDEGGDEQFTESESAIGIGLHETGTFRVRIGSQEYLADPFAYQQDHWYRLSLYWSEPDADGKRSANLFVRDLSNGIDLNNGASVLSLNVESADFAGDSTRWSGLGCRATRGLVDNIRVAPTGFTAWDDTFDNWIKAYHVDGLTSFADDSDGDGISNGAEHYFGTNPGKASAGLAAGAVTPGTSTTFTFTHPLNESPASDIGASYLWSKDLKTFHSPGSDGEGTTVNFQPGTPSNGMVTVTAEIDGPAEDRLFISVEVTNAAP